MLLNWFFFKIYFYLCVCRYESPLPPFHFPHPPFSLYVCVHLSRPEEGVSSSWARGVTEFCDGPGVNVEDQTMSSVRATKSSAAELFFQPQIKLFKFLFIFLFFIENRFLFIQYILISFSSPRSSQILLTSTPIQIQSFSTRKPVGNSKTNNKPD